MLQTQAARRAAELIGVLSLGESSTGAGSYFGGQRRRLEFAFGLMHRPWLLFLGEPTSGLDPQNRADLWVLLRPAGSALNTSKFNFKIVR